jgi:hypothetical protein
MFEIYEDTPEEEAANLMEHSTLTLDLSSDDEEGRKDSSRGKENTPPEGYDAPAASRSASEPAAPPRRVKKTELIRQKANVDEMDDGERSPLSDLETVHFIPEGLDKESYVVIEEGGAEKLVEVKEATTLAPMKKKVDAVPAVRVEEKATAEVVKAEAKEEVVVWEDKENVAA